MVPHTGMAFSGTVPGAEQGAAIIEDLNGAFSGQPARLAKTGKEKAVFHSPPWFNGELMKMLICNIIKTVRR